MSLFSDVDWGILLLAVVLLMMGDHGKEVFRTLGRLYGKWMVLRQEMNLQIQRQLLMDQMGGGGGNVPAVGTITPFTRVAQGPPAPSLLPPAPAPGVAAANGPMREVHTGSGVPRDGPEVPP